MASIKENSFITIQAFMVTELNLKGNDLLVYAVIYGFSQDGESWYTGSIDYLQQWTNSTRQGVINSLKKLCDLGLIEKKESHPTNHYRAILKDEETAPKIVEEEKKPAKPATKFEQQKQLQETAKQVLSTLNDVCGTSYRDTNSNIRLIVTRLKEGFTVNDFNLVIESKYSEWGEKPTMFSNGQLSSTYLRPETLFGQKFDSYLQAAKMKPRTTYKPTSAPILPQVPGKIY